MSKKNSRKYALSGNSERVSRTCSPIQAMTCLVQKTTNWKLLHSLTLVTAIIGGMVFPADFITTKAALEGTNACSLMHLTRKVSETTCKGTLCCMSLRHDWPSFSYSGKNVCIYYLLGKCKFGDIKCIYSHSKDCLPKQGWWNDEEQTAKVKAVIEAAEQQAKEQRALVNLMSKLESKSRKRNGAGTKGRRHANPTDSTTGGSSKGGKKRGGSARRYQSEQEMDERMANNGFTDYELNDLLSQGVKPWDDDAWVSYFPKQSSLLIAYSLYLPGCIARSVLLISNHVFFLCPTKLLSYRRRTPNLHSYIISNLHFGHIFHILRPLWRSRSANSPQYRIC